jgi:predicted nucleic-acid-binding protein
MKAVDTNVLVRFLVQDDEEQARRATSFFATASPEDPVAVPLVVWVETYWVLTAAYRISRADVLGTLVDLLGRDEIRAESPRAVAAALEKAQTANADFADALIAACARDLGCSGVVTFDRRAATSLGLELL